MVSLICHSLGCIALALSDSIGCTSSFTQASFPQSSTDTSQCAGVCHRCLPVYKNGVQVLADTNEHLSYHEVHSRQKDQFLHILRPLTQNPTQALQMADASKQMALHARSPSAFFELDGECLPSTTPHPHVLCSEERSHLIVGPESAPLIHLHAKSK